MARFGLIGAVVVAAAAVLATSGCSNLAYYAQSVNGHLSLVQSAKPVPE